MSWSMRGLKNDARERAVEAAHDAGMPVDEWVDSLIMSGSGSQAGSAPTPRRERNALQDGVDRLQNSTATRRTNDKDGVAEIARALGRLLEEGKSEGVSRRREPARAATLVQREKEPASRRERQPARSQSPRTFRSSTQPPRRDPAIIDERGADERGADERGERVERVLSALNKLDERVRGLSTRSATDEPTPLLRTAENDDTARRGLRASDRSASPAAYARAASRPPAEDENPRRRASDKRSSDNGYGDAGQAPERRVDALQAAISDIAARRDTLQTRRAGQARARDAVARERSPEADYFSGRRQYDRAEPPAIATPAADIDRHFRDLAERIDTLREPRVEAFADLREEIADLRHSIERRERDGTSDHDIDEIQRLVAAVERMQREGHDPRMTDLVRSEIADLRDVVMTQNVDGAMKTLESGYAHIVERLDDMRRHMRDPDMVDALDRRLDGIERGLSDIPRANSFAGFDRRLEEIAIRLEDLSVRHGDAALGHLEGEMRELRVAVADLDVRDLMRSVDDQMRDMLDRIDAVEHGVGHDRDFRDRVLAFEDRLPERGVFDTLNHRMERISTMLAEDRSSAGVGHVDERLGEILGRLDRIERQGASPLDFEKMLSLLESRIDGIGAKLDTMDFSAVDAGALKTVVARLDAAADRVAEPDRLADLQDQLATLAHSIHSGGQSDATAEGIATLRQELGELRKEMGRTETLAAVIEPQIHELAHSLVTSDRAGPDDATLQRIEQQVAVIAGQLDATEERLSGLGDIEAALERIDSVVASKSQLGESGASEGSNVTVDALRSDLARLLDAADDSRRESDDSMERVQSALETIISRLSALENSGSGVRLDRDEPRYSGLPRQSGTDHDAGTPDIADDLDDDLRAVTGASAEPSFRDLTVDVGVRHEEPEGPDLSFSEDMPLEPGSGKPKLDALMRAREDAAAPDDAAGSSDRKTDFIAAARRAAQAASAEIAAAGEAQDREPKERAAWLRDRLKRSRAGDDVQPALAGDVSAREDNAARMHLAKRRRPGGGLGLRRPVIMAAAAVILAIGALKVATMSGIVGGADESSSPSPTQIAQQAQPDAAPQHTDAAVPAGETPRDAVPAAPSSTPDPQTAFQPPSAEPGGFVAPDTMQPYGEFARTPDDAQPPLNTAAHEHAQPADPQSSATGTSTSGSVIPSQNTTSANASTPEKDTGTVAPMPEGGAGAVALRVAAAHGNPRAQYEIAVRYTEGQGVTPDLGKARDWYERAAQGGLAPAQYRLASLYEKGRGVEKNLEKARTWYRRAAEQGNIKAMHNLAVLLADGGLGKPDFSNAATWFEKAADRGVRDSQFNLGVLYARGLGVPKNLVNSYKWFAVAAKLGDADAASKRDEIANQMQESQLAAGRKAAEAWVQEPTDVAANHVKLDAAWKEKPDNSASLGDNGGALVKQAQLLLGELGYDPGPADGVVGPKTRDAVRTFRLQAGLPVSGSIDRPLIKALASRSI